MCKKINKKGCGYLEKLKGKPEDCTSEQIKECHGDIVIDRHPCILKKKKEN